MHSKYCINNLTFSSPCLFNNGSERICLPIFNQKEEYSYFHSCPMDNLEIQKQEYIESICPTLFESNRSIFTLLSSLEQAFPLATAIKNVSLQLLVICKSPSVGWLKLNIDASIKHKPSSVAIGGLILNESGRWSNGFYGRIGTCNLLSAEFWVLREGLTLAWNMRIPNIEVETDSEVAVKIINDGDIRDHPDGSLIADCRQLLRRPWNAKLLFTKRDGNRCADTLAEMGHSSNYVICSTKGPLVEILALLEVDCSDYFLLSLGLNGLLCTKNKIK